MSDLISFKDRTIEEYKRDLIEDFRMRGVDVEINKPGHTLWLPRDHFQGELDEYEECQYEESVE